MNKSILVNQMTLPSDVLYHICSLNFYDIDYVISRNKEIFKKVLEEICNTMRLCYSDYFYMNHKYYVVHFINSNLCGKIINKRLKICMKCSEFIQHRFSKCSCNCSYLSYFILVSYIFTFLLHVAIFKYYIIKLKL